MSKSYLSHLECPKCKSSYDPDQPQQLCACGAPLLARYDLKKAAQEFSKNDLLHREPTLWRYRELLPVRDEANIVSLGEGMTPVIPLTRLGQKDGMDLY